MFTEIKCPVCGATAKNGTGKGVECNCKQGVVVVLISGVKHGLDRRTQVCTSGL